jgi:hypothetical protein
MSNFISVDKVLPVDETADNVLDDSEYRFMNYTRHVLLSARLMLLLLVQSRILKKSKKEKHRPASRSQVTGTCDKG